MKRPAFRACRAVAVVAAALGGIGAACAQNPTPAEFYAGKTITLICSADAGGAVDLNARQVAKHIARFIPGNPAVVVRNMPGGGHTLASNFVYNQAPRDGTTIGTIINSMPLHQATGGQGVRFESTKFNWIGSTGVSNITIMIWHTAGIKSVEEAKAKEVVLGATGVGSGTWIYANALNQLLGTRFKLVTGYRGIVDIDLAIERGEVQGRSGASISGYLKEHSDWLKAGKVFPIIQVGLARDQLFPDVPLIHELETSEDNRRVLKLMSSPVLVGRPYMAPPDTPVDRVAALRRAFDQTMQDAQFIAEANTLSLELNPITGEQLAMVVDEIVRSPPDLLDRVRPIMGIAEPQRR